MADLYRVVQMTSCSVVSGGGDMPVGEGRLALVNITVRRATMVRRCADTSDNVFPRTA